MKPHRLILLLLCLLSPLTSRGADDVLPTNLGASLRQLVAWNQAQGRIALPSSAAAFQIDVNTRRVVADVTLNGPATPDAVRAQLTALGAEVFATYSVPHGNAGSILSTRLPLGSVTAAARLPGVYSIALVRRAHRHVGKATSQGVAALDVTPALQAAYDGKGITVGVISDSFNTAVKGALGNPLAAHAADDIATGDLPGPGNPLGHLTPVNVLSDGTATDTDEGRAMLQIVHDLAPGATLAFATDGGTPESLAASIRNLRTNAATPCDIIVDDIAFAEEPFFSDGPAAQAAADVVNSDKLAGHHVMFYSAAGDQGASGSYDATFAPIPDTTARTGTTAGNLKLDQVPAELTASGFHNFSTRAGKISVSQTVTVEGGNAELDFQWDDPWVPGLVSTDYSLLVFDADGNYLPDLSGTEDNMAMGRAIQIVDLPLGANHANAVYQIAITQRQAGLQQATRLRYLVTTEGALRVQGDVNAHVPAIYGHAAATGADAVAAYAYGNLQSPEGSTSMGPVTIYFDTFGNRLSTPDVREQPTVAAVDGVDTTFFPADPAADTDGDGLPNFFGTSAAAPHAAGVAALLLQAAGGSGSLDATAMRALLQGSAPAHDLDPAHSGATLTDDKNVYTVTLTADGDSGENAAFDKAFFKLNYTGPPASELHKVVISLAASGEEFDPTKSSGFPFKVSKDEGTVKPGRVLASFGGGAPPKKLAVVLADGALKPGGVLAFGVDRDLAATHTGGNSADLLAGAKVKVLLLDQGVTTTLKGRFANETGTGYSPDVGDGLIDAAAALHLLTGK